MTRSAHHIAVRLAAAAVAAALAGCGSAPLQDQSLRTSQALFAAASDTPDIYRYATSDMRQARQYLRQAEQLLEEEATQDQLEHLTFLARKHVAIAEARLRRGLTEARIEHADQRRQSLVVVSEQRAAAAAALQLAEMQARLATSEERARALAAKLLELGVSEPGTQN